MPKTETGGAYPKKADPSWFQMMSKIIIRDSDIHHHLRARMQQRGVSMDEIEITLNKGWKAEDAKEGTIGKVFVFGYNTYWEGRYFEEKEVSVYYRYKKEELILLTVKARYGKAFMTGGRKNENRI